MSKAATDVLDVNIDEHHLDKECVRLPSDLLQYSHAVADCRKDVEELKNKLEVTEAEIAKDIRADPLEYGLDKASEAAIKSIMPTQTLHQKIQQRLVDAKHQLDLNQAVVWALEAKKKSLEMLVQLHGMGYFSSPKTTREGKEAVTKMTMERMASRRSRRNED